VKMVGGVRETVDPWAAIVKSKEAVRGERAGCGTRVQ
jgi:hypothetical protein